MRRDVIKATGLALTVALPALFARPWADERTYLYRSEALAGSNPLRLVARAIDEVPGYLQLGVFRPVSRLLTFLENWVAVRTSIAVGVQPNVVRAAPKALMVAFLAWVVLLTVDQYRRATGLERDGGGFRIFIGSLVATFAAGLTLFNPASHPLTLFPTLYLGSAGFALAVPVMLGRLRDRQVGWRTVAGFSLLGAAAAGMIELAYLAVPLGLLHLAVLEVADGGRPRPSMLWRTGVGRAWTGLAAGFLLVAVPARLAIAVTCREVVCYQAAQPAFGVDLAVSWPVRVLAGFFPVLQLGQFESAARALLTNRHVWGLAVLAAGAAAVILARSWSGTFAKFQPAPWLRFVAVYFSAVLLLGAGLSATSATIQSRGFDLSPWREMGFTWTGWAVLLATGVAWLVAGRNGRLLRLGLGVLLVGGVFLASVQNQADMNRIRAEPENRIHHQIALMLVHFDRSPEGNRARCLLIDDLIDLFEEGTQRNQMVFLAGLVDQVALNHYGEPFCADPSRGGRD
jgi:hypothetical protein